MFELDQYIDIFLDESKEHMENLNSNLLELENNPSNKEIVNEIFRIAHTLKGMSATMGFEKLAELTHNMENVLDEIRSGKMDINTNIIDTLFEVLDKLDSFIKNIEASGNEGAQDVDDLIERLKNTGEIQTPVSQQKEDVKIEGGDKVYIDSVIMAAKENNLKSYDIHIALDEKCMLKAARAFLVFKAIEENGEIIYSNPPTEDIEDENFELEFEVVTITSLDANEIKEKILSISEIREVHIKEYSSGEDAKSSEPVKGTLIEDIESKDIDEEIKDVDILVSNVKKEVQKHEEIKVEHVKKEVKKVTDDKKAEAEEQSSQRKGKVGKTVRVDINRLDNLMNLVSELIIVKTRLEDIEMGSKNQNVNDAVEYLETITTNLHDAVMKVRMVPIERVFNRFPRMIRDLSKNLNKEVHLVMSGEETEVDRTVIDEIGDPLIHLLRNSIDHGIETPEIRAGLNKSEMGTVKLLAYPDGNNVVIEVVDDGSGLDTEKIKNKALKKALIPAEKADLMDEKEIANLIFMPGFSTADKISDVSGRGVGLDVVKTKIESLGGVVEIETEKNVGSKFIIRLPLTLAIIQALLVIVGEEKYAIPLNNIKEITNIEREQIRVVEGRDIVLYRGKTLPLVDLGQVLDVEERNMDSRDINVIVVKKGDKDLGIVVDELLGQQEIVIKSLGKYLKGINFVAGATILGNGSVALIIDTNSLF
ncbi:two-component system, chemotaxis family, sensor kinase CheA [Peptoclostridium litorale DSM 5388]|uniref:Chemotaxis protein CheA n=1 Tax=Peptoclostridium litorale DSM 5388 TaxID=1121324 RepID=A0A069RGA2_PEPLI|nr:chemotaxis protein CheA [Peptoclostridium litorale]KDR95185.1 chemotaxis protein CheA [Peptoclostridium litorale DSM 5388]SIN73669.1 two-component system, chemotaxis family, sensor kinase CheA [Peptoclostridium litorale DSM 5388]